MPAARGRPHLLARLGQFAVALLELAQVAGAVLCDGPSSCRRPIRRAPLSRPVAMPYAFVGRPFSTLWRRMTFSSVVASQRGPSSRRLVKGCFLILPSSPGMNATGRVGQPIRAHRSRSLTTRAAMLDPDAPGRLFVAMILVRHFRNAGTEKAVKHALHLVAGLSAFERGEAAGTQTAPTRTGHGFRIFG